MSVRKLDNIWSELQLITIVKAISSISSYVKMIINQVSKNHLSKSIMHTLSNNVGNLDATGTIIVLVLACQINSLFCYAILIVNMVKISVVTYGIK